MSMGSHLGQQVRETLAALNYDLNAESTFDFYLYLPTEASAGLAAAALGSAYQCSLQESASGDGQWLCLASRRLVPDEQLLDEIGARFEQLAREHAGEFDGWERHPEEDESGPELEDLLAGQPLLRLVALQQLHDDQQYDAVIDLGTAITAEDPTTKPMVLPLMAWSHLKANRPDQAEELLRNALIEQPEDAELWANLGTALVRQERFQEAEETYQTALALDPQCGPAHYGLACCAALCGQQGLAMSLLTQAFEVDPVLSLAAPEDEDLAMLHPLPEFRNLLDQAKSAAAEALEREDAEMDELKQQLDELGYTGLN